MSNIITDLSKDLGQIVQVQWGRSREFSRLFDEVMKLIQGGVGEEFTEDNYFLRARMHAQYMLENHSQSMKPLSLERMIAEKDEEGRVKSAFRHATFAYVRDSRPLAVVYGSLLNVEEEPMMFMGYAAKRPRFMDVDDKVIRQLLNTLYQHLDNKSLDINGKPIKHVAIEMEKHNRKDIPLAKWAIKTFGAYPLKLKEDEKGFAYTSPGIDAEKHGKARHSPQRWQLFYGRVDRLVKSLDEASKRTYDATFIRKMFDAIIGQEYIDYSTRLGAGSRTESFALKKCLASVKGLEQVGYDISKEGIVWLA